MLTPNEFLNKKFEKSKMGGYRTADVDSFMVEAASLFSQQNRENAEIKRKLEAVEKKLAEYERDQDSLRQALLSAQRLADNIIKDAKAKSELMIRDAEIRSEKMIEKAKDAIVGEQDELERVRNEVTEFRSGLMKIYRSHLELIHAIPVNDNSGQDDDGAGRQPETGTETADEATVQEKPVQKPDDEKEEPNGQNNGQTEPTDTFTAFEQAAAARAPGIPAQEPDDTETVAEMPAESADSVVENVRLNLKYDEESGEYIPITPAK